MTLIIGLPNAGKTEYSKRFSYVVHYDEISHIKQVNRISIYTEAEIIEGIYNSIKSRSRILSAWKGNKIKTCIWLDTPLEVCLERERKGRMRGDHLVLHHAKAFEPPTLDEGWDEIIIIRGDKTERISRETKD